MRLFRRLQDQADPDSVPIRHYREVCDAYYRMPQHRWDRVPESDAESYADPYGRSTKTTYDEVCAVCGWRAHMVVYHDATPTLAVLGMDKPDTWSHPLSYHRH